MTTTGDASIGMALESTYGTGVTVTRWLEYVDESLDFRKAVKQGVGLRVGGRLPRSARRVVATSDAGGDITVEATSKGMGLLLQAALGSGVSTVVTAPLYQQNFTLGDVPPSLTIQKGLVEAGGTVDAYTFTGCMVDSLEIDFTNADIMRLKAVIDAQGVGTATAYAAPTYPTTPTLFQFANASINTGTLTAPTATALGSAATPLADVRGGSLTINNNLKTDRYNVGAAGKKAKPTVGLRSITGKLDVEYDNTTFRDAVLNDTPMSLVLNYTGATVGSGVETFQIVLPEVKFDGQLPATNGTDLITVPLTFTVLDNLTATQPIWIVLRTADTAL